MGIDVQPWPVTGEASVRMTSLTPSALCSAIPPVPLSPSQPPNSLLALIHNAQSSGGLCPALYYLRSEVRWLNWAVMEQATAPHGTRVSPPLTQNLRPKAGGWGFQKVRTLKEGKSSHTPQSRLPQDLRQCEAGGRVGSPHLRPLNQARSWEVIWSTLPSTWTHPQETSAASVLSLQSAEPPKEWEEE